MADKKNKDEIRMIVSIPKSMHYKLQVVAKRRSDEVVTWSLAMLVREACKRIITENEKEYGEIQVPEEYQEKKDDDIL